MNDQATPWMRTTLRAPTLSLEAERDLLKRVNDGDQAALGSIMLSQFKVVFRIAKRYQHMGLDLDDLVQEAFVGLQRAIKKFTPDRECSLATYASHWIMLTITRSLTTKGHLIRLPPRASLVIPDHPGGGRKAASDAHGRGTRRIHGPRHHEDAHPAADLEDGNQA
jgi:RNA polymerase sigma factor (sigma-70 family)